MGPNPDQWKLAGQILGSTFLYNKEIFNQGTPFLVSVAVPTCDAQNCCSHLMFRKADITSALKIAEQLYPCYLTEYLHASGTFLPCSFLLHNTRHNSSCASFLASDDYLPWCSCQSRWRIVLVLDIFQTHLCCDPKCTVYQLLISQFWFLDSVIRNRELIYIGEILIEKKLIEVIKKEGEE